MLDATKSEEQRKLLEFELDAVGIRLNKTKPDIVFKKRTTGGVRAQPFVCRTWWSKLNTDHIQYDCQTNEDGWKDDKDDSRWMYDVCVGFCVLADYFDR